MGYIGWVSATGIVRITIAYFARARECAGTGEEHLEFIQPVSVRQLFSRVIAIHPTLAEIQQVLSLLVNGKWVPQETELKDGDRVALLPPVGGG